MSGTLIFRAPSPCLSPNSTGGPLDPHLPAVDPYGAARSPSAAAELPAQVHTAATVVTKRQVRQEVAGGQRGTTKARSWGGSIRGGLGLRKNSKKDGV